MAETGTPSAQAPVPTKPSKPSNEQLKQRVRAILEGYRKRNAPFPNEDEVAQALRQFHREYRKNTNPEMFKKAVSRAVGEVMEMFNEDQQEGENNEEGTRKRQKRNALASSLNTSYKSASASNGENESKQPEKQNARKNRPTARYSDVGGLEPHLQEIRELCEYPLRHPEIYSHLGVQPPRGVLLHGPPGCGKTLLAHAIAGELDVAFFKIAAPEIVSGMSGESEEKLRQLFQDAAASAPAIIFIDEIDAITSKRESGTRGMELRIVAQLLTCMDGVGRGSDGVIVIGATNRPDALDPALRRAGRFDREICLGIPDEEGRENILRVLVSRMRITGDFDFKKLARLTPGFVGADLDALTKEAAVVAVNRIFQTLEAKELEERSEKVENADGDLEARNVASAHLRLHTEPLTPEELEPLYVELNDFLVALPKVQPSSKREGFATVPAVTWDDVGALAEAREELDLAITQPVRHPDRFKAMGLTVPAGVLLFGPPGCGKSLLAKAVANSSGANFISIKGPELLNKYVGESERAVRQVFSRARASAPCIVFFDELDALAPRRDSSGGGGDGNGVSERVVNQLLTEMDGLDARKSVFVVAATNRPELIDPAMLRPGRLDRLVYVPLPSTSDRAAILRACTRKTPLDKEMDLDKIAQDPRAEGLSGADLAALVREAAIHALRRSGALSAEDTPMEGAPNVTYEDFDYALRRVSPSVSDRDRRDYERMSAKLSSVRDRQQQNSSLPRASQNNGKGGATTGN